MLVGHFSAAFAFALLAPGGSSWVVRPRKNVEVIMVQTYGLTHINLAVRDLGRALRFYEQVFGLREYGRGDGLVHTQASGRHDILTFAEDPARGRSQRRRHTFPLSVG